MGTPRTPFTNEWVQICTHFIYYGHNRDWTDSLGIFAMQKYHNFGYKSVP